MTHHPLAIEVDSRGAGMFVAVACRLWPIIGRARALRLALWAGYRFASSVIWMCPVLETQPARLPAKFHLVRRIRNTPVSGS